MLHLNFTLKLYWYTMKSVKYLFSTNNSSRLIYLFFRAKSIKKSCGPKNNSLTEYNFKKSVKKNKVKSKLEKNISRAEAPGTPTFSSVSNYSASGSSVQAPFSSVKFDQRIKLDLPYPHTWFPLARKLKRKFYLHIGPTNSGKTYSAIQALQVAKTGLYAGPLRLLAWEVYDKLSGKGILCDLLTGQEREQTVGSTHVSCIHSNYFFIRVIM
jgi:hypothetical protein